MGEDPRKSQRGGGLPLPGKTHSSAVKKSFGAVKNFWRQMEGGRGQPARRNYGRRLEPQPEAEPERVKLRHVHRPSMARAHSPEEEPGGRPAGRQSQRKSQEHSQRRPTARQQSQRQESPEVHPSPHHSQRRTTAGQQGPTEGDAHSPSRHSQRRTTARHASQMPPATEPAEPRQHSQRQRKETGRHTEESQRVPIDQPEEDLSIPKIPDVVVTRPDEDFVEVGPEAMGRGSRDRDRLFVEDEHRPRSRGERHPSLEEQLRAGGDERPPSPPPPPLPNLRLPSFHPVDHVREVVLKRPSIFLPVLLEEEKYFHELVASGDLSGVQDFLERNPDFNINCTNYQGSSALQIAVQNGDMEMTDYLLAHPLVECGDAHLFAIRDGRVELVQLLLDRLQAVDPALEFMAVSGSAEFSDTLTPLILAAESGHFEVIRLLLDRGHRIPVPHPPKCFCKEECQVMMKTQDPLSVASGKLHIYRALSSPAYICQTSEDPFLTAFELERELKTCGQLDLIFLRQYEDLAHSLRWFAADLVAECRNLEEVELILSETKGSNIRKGYRYPRLVLAMDYDQKEFVSHPNIQKVLERIWIGDWYAWAGYNKYVKAFYVFPRMGMLPVILGVLMFTPTSRWARHYALPVNKLLSYFASYTIFLILVFFQSNQDKKNQTRETKPTGLEVFLAIYVITFIYDTVRGIVFETPKRFFSVLWNWYEVIMEILFLLTFMFWIIAAIRTAASGEEFKNTERKYWKSMDPELIAEGIFVVASIMAYLKIMFILQMSYQLGPLQVMLGKMTNDCALYSAILAIIVVAFTAGLCTFYAYYEGMYQMNEETKEVDSKQENSFTSLLDTFKTLFWGLFGMVGVEHADVVISPIEDEEGKTEINEHHFTEFIGYLVLAVYMVLTSWMIVNMLVATMSNTQAKVTENVDIEWAFGRTEVKLSYINKPVLPPPFNIIPTTSGLVSLFKGAKETAVRLTGKQDVEKGLMEERREEEYRMLISQLVQRYFSTKQGDMIT